METDPRVMEKQAYELFGQDNFNEAYRLFFSTAHLYKNQENHQQASLCFASAASCWGLKSGEKAFYNAAIAYEEAARAAARAHDPEYASLLYRYAAVNYERDMEFMNFSDCVYLSKECYRQFLTMTFLHPERIRHIIESKEKTGFLESCRRARTWLILTFSSMIWGHGERPARTLFAVAAVILLGAIVYTQGTVVKNGIPLKPHFLDALYFSVSTFTTVGFGDIIALGWAKGMVMFEALCGIFIMPLFVVGLSRKYLRV